MRIALASVLALLLAGCTQGSPGGDGDDFVGSCPSWIKYPHNALSVQASMQWTNRSMDPATLVRWDARAPAADKPGAGFGDGERLSYEGHPLDQVVFDFHMREGSSGKPSRMLYVQDGELRMRFYASEDGQVGEPLTAYDVTRGKASALHEWVFSSDDATSWSIYNITLTVDLAADDADPAPRGVFVEWELVPNRDGDIDTASVAVMHYTPDYWYRTCSRDGTQV